MADIADRGQLLLVTALGMAVLLVTMALVLNTAIYTENLATRSSEIGGGTDAVRYQDTVEEGIGGLLDYVNHHNNTSHDALASNLTTGIESWTNVSSKAYAIDGKATNTSAINTTNGTRILQEDGSRNFSNASLTEGWTLAEDVNGTRKFRFNVTDDADIQSFGDADAFRIVVDDGSSTWRLNVTDDAGTTTIGIENGTGAHFTCPSSVTEPWVNVTAGTVAGEECDGLDFADGIGTPYSVSFENADNVTGTYTLIVDNESLAQNAPTTHLNDEGGGSPYATPAVYSAEMRVVYQSPRMYYKATIRVAPGEADG